MRAMRDQLRDTLLSLRDLVATAAPFVVLAVGAARRSPTGCSIRRRRAASSSRPARTRAPTPSSASATSQILKENGITVRLRKTAGAAENIALLREPGGDVDIAFVQGGADDDRPRASDDGDVADDGLVSLGSLFYEPVWLFYRSDSAERLLKAPELTSLAQLAGWRVNIGAPGSGVPNLMARLIEANRHRPGDAHAASASRRRRRSSACSTAASTRSSSPPRPSRCWCRCCCRRRASACFDFAQAEAYARRFPFLSPVTLPRGVVDLARDIPPADVRLVAPTATLVARKEHPSGADPAVRPGGAAGARRRRLVPARRATSRTRATPSGRSPRKRSASTPAARRCCSATCRSGSPT